MVHEPKLASYISKKQSFWYFLGLWNREIQVNPRNPAKFARNLIKYMSNIFETYLGYIQYIGAV